ALDRPLSLIFGQEGAVFYSYDSLYLRKVDRYSPTGQLLYTHERKGYDLSGHLTDEDLIGDLGQIHHTTDRCGRNESVVSPYFSQQCRYDSCGNLVAFNEEENHTYTYDDLSQLTLEISKNNAQVYQYDSLRNRLAKNGEAYKHNALNELTQGEYDLNGNQLVSGEWELIYDPLNQLVEAKRRGRSLHFAYDPLGRRLTTTANEEHSQGKEEYLYDGQEEIGSFTPGLEVQNLKILGKSTQGSFPSPIAIEIDDTPFAPIVDLQGNVRHLLDLRTKKIVNRYAYSAFGEPLETYEKVFNPWRYAAKRIDPELGFLYFGKRYYDPAFSRWLTTDPAGFVDSMNLYQYCLNNPFAYLDPNGELLFLIPLVPLLMGGSITALVVGTAVASVVAAGVVWGGQKLHNYYNNRPEKSNSRQSYWEYEALNQGLGLGSRNEPLNILLRRPPNYYLPRENVYRPAAATPEGAIQEGWIDVSHPGAKGAGHTTLRDPETGDKWRFDKGDPKESGHKAHDHWHHENPNKTGRHDKYLDKDGQPCGDHSEASHLYY
ncbi:MAG: RHS repeat-associated core domain-containing protein, partial [Verrucomicrobia bacterium]|nr:RHS repeat-associated core domain-containing protein [Verrucomicrobiota bacterium]